MIAIFRSDGSPVASLALPPVHSAADIFHQARAILLVTDPRLTPADRRLVRGTAGGLDLRVSGETHRQGEMVVLLRTAR